MNRFNCFALFLFFVTCQSHTAFAVEGGTAQPVLQPDPFIEIKGRLMIDSKSHMPGGVVSLFDVTAGPPPNYGNVRRIPDLVAQVGADGSFSAKVLVGKYYLGTLNRKPEQGPGPPRPGEKLYFAMNKDGIMRIIEVLADGKKDFGDILVAPSADFQELPDFFSVEGVVKDETGKPVSDAMIMIKIDLNSPRPDMISANTGKDGRYRIKLPAGKTYHFIARNTISPGRPMIGSYVGTYNGPKGLAPSEQSDQESFPLPVTGKAGEVISGIDITVSVVPDPEAIKKQNQEEAAKEQQKIEVKEKKNNDKPSP